MGVGLTEARAKNRHLPIPAPNRARHQGDAERMARRIDGKAGFKLVGAIEHKVGTRNQAFGIAFIQALHLHFHFNRGVQMLDRGLACADFIDAHIFCFEQDLSLQIGKLHHIGINQDQATNPGSRQIKRRRCPQSAHANQRHSRLCQPLLPGTTNLFEENMPSVPVESDVTCFHRGMMTAPVQDGKIGVGMG